MARICVSLGVCPTVRVLLLVVVVVVAGAVLLVPRKVLKELPADVVCDALVVASAVPVPAPRGEARSPARGPARGPERTGKLLVAVAATCCASGSELCADIDEREREERRWLCGGGHGVPDTGYRALNATLYSSYLYWYRNFTVIYNALMTSNAAQLYTIERKSFLC